MASNFEAKRIIEKIASEVRSDARQLRLNRAIKLVLDSFSYEHVFTELLQNADDCEKATFARIEVTNDGVFFTHDGKPFDEPDMQAICDIGISTKKPEAHIGFMGIGFKAAFKLSDTPQVFSNRFSFSFRREDVIVPYLIEDIPEEVKRRLTEGLTLFYLPFRKDFPKDIIDSLQNILRETFEPICLVFLRRILELNIVCSENVRTLRKNAKGRHEITVTETVGDKQKSFEYYVFKRTAKISETARNDPRARDSKRSELKTTNVSLVFNIREGTFHPSSSSVLYTFLPTPYVTGLRFAINADFLLNTQRVEPDWTSPWNRWLFDEILAAIKYVIDRISKDKKRRFALFDLIPRKNETAPNLVKILHTPLVDFVKQSPLILTADNQMVQPVEAAFASKEIQKVIPPQRAGVKYYVHPNVKGRDFLRDELSVKDVMVPKEERRFVFEAVRDKKWLTTLTPKQFGALYDLLYEKIILKEGPESWSLEYYERINVIDELRELSIVKCLDETLQIPRDTILPSKKKMTTDFWSLPCLHVVDKKVLSKKVLKLLKEIGAKDFSEDSLANRILESHEKNEPMDWSEKHKLASIEFFAKYLQRKTKSVPEDLKTKIGSLFLPIEGGQWARAKVCYEPDMELKKLLPGSPYTDTIRLPFHHTQKLLKKLGVVNFPRVKSCGPGGYNGPKGISDGKWKEYWSWLGDQSYRSYEGYSHEIEENFTLEGFDKYLVNAETGKRRQYLFYIMHHWEEYYRAYMKTSINWFHYRPRAREIPSYFAFQLKTQAWLPTTQGFKTPSETFLPSMENKRVAGKIVPFADLTQEELRGSYAFFESIGVTVRLDIHSIHEILNKVRFLIINEETRKQLEKLYERLYIEVQKSTSVKPDYEWHLIDKKGKFEPSAKLYWIDDPELEEQFENELSVVWIPSNLARPQLTRLFDFLDVLRVSAVLKRELAEYSEGKENVTLVKRIRRSANYVYSILSHYQAEKTALFSVFIQNLKVITVNELALKINVSDVQKIKPSSCFCDLDGSILYVSSNAKIEDYSREIARAFGAPLESAIPIEIVLSDIEGEKIADKLARSSIQVLQLISKPTTGQEDEPREEPLENPSQIEPPKVQKPTEQIEEQGDLEKEDNDKDTKQSSTNQKPSVKPEVRKVIMEPREILESPSENLPKKQEESQFASVGEKYIGPRPTTRIDHKPFEIEEKARKKVVEYEQKVDGGRDVQIVSNWANLGYDIISRGKDGTTKYIEIKGSTEDFDELGIAESQFEASKKYRTNYFIYRVAFTDSDPIIYAIQDPYPELEKAAEPVKSFKVRGWAAVFAHKIRVLNTTEETK